MYINNQYIYNIYREREKKKEGGGGESETYVYVYIYNIQLLYSKIKNQKHEPKYLVLIHAYLFHFLHAFFMHKFTCFHLLRKGDKQRDFYTDCVRNCSAGFCIFPNSRSKRRKIEEMKLGLFCIFLLTRTLICFSTHPTSHANEFSK